MLECYLHNHKGLKLFSNESFDSAETDGTYLGMIPIHSVQVGFSNPDLWENML